MAIIIGRNIYFNFKNRYIFYVLLIPSNSAIDQCIDNFLQTFYVPNWSFFLIKSMRKYNWLSCHWMKEIYRLCTKVLTKTKDLSASWDLSIFNL